MASGAGTIRDVVTIANNPDAPLAKKVALYDASALMSPRDKTRLGNLLSVVMETGVVSVSEAEPPALPEPPRRPPTGPGTPTAAKSKAHGTRRERLDVIRLTPEPRQRRFAAATFEDKARRILAQHPDAGKRVLAKLIGCSESTAGRLRKKLLAEAAASEQYAQ